MRWTGRFCGGSALQDTGLLERVRAQNKMRTLPVRGKKVFKPGTAARSFGTLLADFLYPRRCPVCGKILRRDEPLICGRCRTDLPWVREPFCIRCGKQISDPEKALCADCAKADHVFNEGRSALLYEKGVRQSVNRMKFYNHREYIPFYAACLYVSLKQYLNIWKVRCIIPVPMHPKKKAERGYDQAVLLAREFSCLCGLPVREDILERVRYTKASRKLGRQHRKANMRGAFRVRNDLKEEIPEPVLLLDDIYTTGTTMDNCARALRRAHVREIYFITLCTGRGAE